MTYEVNKGIGKSVTFNGLRAQYLAFFGLGILGVFISTVLLSILGCSAFFVTLYALLTTSTVIFSTFHLNKKYGPNGLMKLYAVRRHPDYLINRKTVRDLLKTNSHHEK